MRGEKDRRGKLRLEALRQIEIDIEAPQIAPLLEADLLDLVLGKHLPSGSLLDVRQRQKSRGKQLAGANLLRRHAPEAVPGHTPWKFDAHASLHRFPSTGHHHAGLLMIRQIVALVEHVALLLHHLRLRRLVIRLGGIERQ